MRINTTIDINDKTQLNGYAYTWGSRLNLGRMQPQGMYVETYGSTELSFSSVEYIDDLVNALVKLKVDFLTAQAEQEAKGKAEVDA